MSQVKNTGSQKAGCIYRITLANFVTYQSVELLPNSSLNLIIGPNGTGKSTFVCAIILGLCGKPSVIGRAKKISEYVRSGCEEATIEIELYQRPGQKNVIITRTFNTSDQSKWYIDHKSVPVKQVQELIASLNIQVDNLCQLLPQDRVQDFSKMNSQELLRSTLSAVGGQESVSQLDELIECRTKQRGLSTQLQTNRQTMEEYIRLNERLKVIIDAMQQRKEIEKQIEICEKKKMFLEYKFARDKVVELTRDKNEAVKIVKTHQSKVEPLERVIEGARVEIGQLEQKKLAANKKTYALKDQAKEIMNAVRTQELRLKEIEGAYQDKVERYRNRERELQESKAKLEKLIMDKSRLVEKVGDAQMDLAEIREPIRKTNAAIENQKKKKLEVQYDLENNVMPQIRLYQNKIRKLEDVDNKRLEVLRAYSEDTYKAVLWLRDNREKFQQPVYEPMMLEIRFTDPKYARYLESTVAGRDLIAFTFESTQDMNLFLQNVRRGLGLKQVNAVCSQSGPLDRPPNNIQQLSYLGFYTYLVDTITAPSAIVRYLCRNYSIHRVPIGNEHTYNNSGNVPANINFFFTENHRFSVRVSAYSGEKSTSTTEIRAPKLLANTVDVDQIDNFTKQLSTFEQVAQSHRASMQEVDRNLTKLETSLNELNLRRKAISEGVEKVRTITAQIRIQTKKVEDIEREATFDIEQERQRCRQKQKACILKQCNSHVELKQCYTTLCEETKKALLWKTKLDISRNGIVDQENELRLLKTELRNVQATLENIENQLTRAKSDAKEKLQDAKKSCNNKLPEDKDFPYKKEFADLPSDLAKLQEHCYELQTKVDFMDKGDEQVIKEYEERERMIDRLRSEDMDSSNVTKTLEAKMNSIKKAWLPPLENLLRDIDKSFGDMFAKLGCAGEIKLEKAGDDEDYDKYGISILVRFRESEQLQQLTRHTQSGGERALSTALYLMALQRLSTVPFRCVDEINQGMDPINERKMFELLVKVTTECDNAQYFLLTPKLLANLNYNEKIMVHTIMNGRKIIHYNNWNHDTFLQRALQYRMS